MKRILSFVLCLIFLFSVAGCANESQKSEEKKPVAEEKVEEKPEEPEDIFS